MRASDAATAGLQHDPRRSRHPPASGSDMRRSGRAVDAHASRMRAMLIWGEKISGAEGCRGYGSAAIPFGDATLDPAAAGRSPANAGL